MGNPVFCGVVHHDYLNGPRRLEELLEAHSFDWVGVEFQEDLLPVAERAQAIVRNPQRLRGFLAEYFGELQEEGGSINRRLVRRLLPAMDYEVFTGRAHCHALGIPLVFTEPGYKAPCTAKEHIKRYLNLMARLTFPEYRERIEMLYSQVDLSTQNIPLSGTLLSASEVRLANGLRRDAVFRRRTQEAKAVIEGQRGDGLVVCGVVHSFGAIDGGRTPTLYDYYPGAYRLRLCDVNPSTISSLLRYLEQPSRIKRRR